MTTEGGPPPAPLRRACSPVPGALQAALMSPPPPPPPPPPPWRPPPPPRRRPPPPAPRPRPPPIRPAPLGCLQERGRRRRRGRRGGAPEGELGAAAAREAALLVHRAHRHGHPELPQQAPDAQRDLPVPAGALPLLPRRLPGLEELRAPQPLAQRVLHQAAQGPRAARQGPLLDHRPGQRVHVRGGLVPPPAARLQAEVPGAQAHVPPRGERLGLRGLAAAPGLRLPGAPSAPLGCHSQGGYGGLDMMPAGYDAGAGAPSHAHPHHHHHHHHVPHMSPNPGSTYMASCPVPAGPGASVRGGGGGDYGPDSSSSPVPSSPAMASAIECHSPYTSPAAHWSSPGASPYLKQPPALTPSSNPAASAGLHSSMSSYSLEQSYLHQNAREDLSVGLPRYQHHSTPVCDRKDFVLNFNGISSFHPSASGSYYHHHHQSVCQDIKPCVM
uniref:Forkhead box F2 n=1 Tax=Macaca fascicularis TaxID=9541 RepID=A0A2K5U6U4_MACFA